MGASAATSTSIVAVRYGTDTCFIDAFFEEDSTLDYFPAWQREYLRWVRHGGDFKVPSGKVEQPSY